MIPKLTPNVTDVASFARAAEEAGADAVSLVNTFLAMAIDVETRQPKLTNVLGGLSGPAIRPIAVRMVWECSQAVKLPILGMGGIATVEDALEFIIAGASAVQVGTANFVDPFIWEQADRRPRRLPDPPQDRARARPGRLAEDRREGARVNRDSRRARRRRPRARWRSPTGAARQPSAASRLASQLFTAAGPDIVRALVARGDRVFLDLKFHDIPNTVAGAVRAASDLGVWMVNVHAERRPPMMEAARRAADEPREIGGARPLVIAVTVLTSLDAETLASVGVSASPLDQVRAPGRAGESRRAWTASWRRRRRRRRFARPAGPIS